MALVFFTFAIQFRNCVCCFWEKLTAKFDFDWHFGPAYKTSSPRIALLKSQQDHRGTILFNANSQTVKAEQNTLFIQGSCCTKTSLSQNETTLNVQRLWSMSKYAQTLLRTFMHKRGGTQSLQDTYSWMSFIKICRLWRSSKQNALRVFYEQDSFLQIVDL